MIKIVSDTGTDFPDQVIEEYGISFIWGYLVFGDEVVRDDMDMAQFYERLAATDQPTSTQDPTVDDAKEAYERVLADNPDATILSIHVSSTLSTTIEKARLAAAAFPDVDIRIFDTRSVSLAGGLMVYEAGRLARAGVGVDAILQHLAIMRDRMQLYFTLDTLDYLAMGGRVGPVERLVGNLLDLKPVLTLRNGNAENHAIHRTRVRAIDALRELAIGNGRGKRDLKLGVLHAVCEDDARKLADELQATLTPDVLLISDIGPGVGMHAGPGALGVCWYAPD